MLREVRGVSNEEGMRGKMALRGLGGLANQEGGIWVLDNRFLGNLSCGETWVALAVSGWLSELKFASGSTSTEDAAYVCNITTSNLRFIRYFTRGIQKHESITLPQYP